MQNREANTSIRQKLGSILGLSTSRGPQQLLQRIDELGRPEQSPFFTADVLRELDSGVPLQQRVRALRELHEIVATKHLEEHAVEAVWNTIKDLIHPAQPPNVRHQALTFITALIKGQYEDIGLFRAHFFDVVKNHDVKEDTAFRLLMLQVLTKSGRDIQYMEDKIGPFLLSWMPQVFSTDRATEFLTLLIGLIHYNATYIDEDVLTGLVQLTCAEARGTKYPDFIEKSLDLLSAVVCYSSLPIDALQAFITIVCHTLNIERFIERSLEVVLKLLATHLGRSVIYTMCDMMKDSMHPHDPLLMRGAVFYVSMSLWGIRRVSSLDLSFSMVLPYIRQAAHSKHTIVVYEVALSISRLVRKYHIQLNTLEWDHIYASMEAIYSHALLQSGDSEQNSLIHCIGDLVSNIENLYNASSPIGSSEHFFGFMELCKEALPLHSVISLLAFKARSISATGEEWLHQLHCLMEKFYRREGRAVIRMEALRVLGQVLEQHFGAHEDQLMSVVILPVLQPITEDPEPEVRCKAVQIVVRLVSEASSLSSASRLLNVIDAMLQKGIELTGVRKPAGEPCLPCDCKTAVDELILVLKSKLYSSSPLAELIYNVLIRCLQQLYDRGLHSSSACILKLQIFSCVLSLRSNEYGQLGFIEKDTGQLNFSPFYVCHADPLDNGGSYFVPKTLNFKPAFMAVLSCLEQERDWDVLTHVVRQLQGLLENRTLTLAGMPDLSTLCVELCQLMDEQRSPSIGRQATAQKSWCAEMGTCVYPVLGSLCTYPSHLSRSAQQILVCCLEVGLVGSGAQPCVAALQICLLEFQATMKRLLPKVLYRVGQIVATPTMALPVLELLLSIISVPEMYYSFVEKDYLCVFGVALTYTDPKYNTYILATAHRTIALWFVCCRTLYRPSLAKFITKTLLSNLVQPRAGSIISPQLNTAKQRSVTHSRGTEDTAAVETLTYELTEVCLEMLARYTYSNLSTQPCRSSGLRSLFHAGCSTCKTWIVGNSLVTVTTTSGGMCMVCTNQKGTGPHSFGTSSRPKAGRGCLARGWAEIKIRRLTGTVSWALKVQNRLQIYSSIQPREWVRDSDYDLVLFNQLGAADLQTTRDYREPHASLTYREPHASLTYREPHASLTYREPHASLTYREPHASLTSKHIAPSASKMAVSQQDVTPLVTIGPEGGISLQGTMPSNCILSSGPLRDEETMAHIPAPFSVDSAEVYQQEDDDDPSTPRVNEAPCAGPLTPKVTSNDPLTPKVSDLVTSKVDEAPSTDPLTSTNPLTPKVNEAAGGTVISTLSFESVSIEQYEEDGEEEEEGGEEVEEDGEEVEEDGEEKEGSEEGHHSIPHHKWLAHNLSKRHSTSLSWSEGGEIPTHSLRRHVSVSAVSMELLPPLLSYDLDEGTVLGRSPSLCGKQDLLSEEQQINLVVSVAAQSDIGSDEDRCDTSTDDSEHNVGPRHVTVGKLVGHSNPHPVAVTAYVGHNDPSKEPPGVSTYGQSQTADDQSQTADDQSQTADDQSQTADDQSQTADGPAQTADGPAQTADGPAQIADDQSQTADDQSQTADDQSQTADDQSQTADGPAQTADGPAQTADGPAQIADGPAQTADDQSQTAEFTFSQASSSSSSPEDNDVYYDPSFIFLQFYCSSTLGASLADPPLLVPNGEAMARAMKLLDLIPAYDTHKIGVIYVDKDQTQEQTILANTHCSSRFMEMLKGLGQLVDIQNCSSDSVYLGGLDQGGGDGQFTYFYEDGITQVVFHVATLMPTLPSNPQSKKLHIGNDYVIIVYNNSTKPYTFGTIKGQFNFFEVVIEPLPAGMNRVVIQVKKGMEEMLNLQTALISDTWLPILVREKALQANVMSLVHQSRAAPEQYLSNWLGRLRSIKRIREKCISEQPSPQGASFGLPDFTAYSS